MRHLIVVLCLLFVLISPAQGQIVHYNLQGAGGYGGYGTPGKYTYRYEVNKDDLPQTLARWGLGALVLGYGIHEVASYKKEALRGDGYPAYGGRPVERRYVVETREVRFTPVDEADEWHQRARAERAKETFYGDAKDTLRTKGDYLKEREKFEKQWGGEAPSAEIEAIRKELELTKQELRQLKEGRSLAPTPGVPPLESPKEGGGPEKQGWQNPYPRDLKLRPDDGGVEENPAKMSFVRHASIEPTDNRLYEMDMPATPPQKLPSRFSVGDMVRGADGYSLWKIVKAPSGGFGYQLVSP